MREMNQDIPHKLIVYLMEALGLAIFMTSACFFGGMLESLDSSWHIALPNPSIRLIIMGVMMGLTALFIFYSPFTAPSGSQINPAVTLAFLRVNKINKLDACFYILFQFAGGTIAVYAMASIMQHTLTNPPVNYVTTVPSISANSFTVFITEYTTAFIMMIMVLFTSAHPVWKNYTKPIAACLVTTYVIIAGPISGFGMNPARTFASALPAHIWTDFWIYVIAPISGMLCAAEYYVWRNVTRNAVPSPNV